MTVFILAAVLCFCFPGEVLAWGGGVHLQLGVSALANLSCLDPALAAVISACPHDFLYGCISADITVGKKFTHYMLNCHRWKIGQRILESAESEHEQACGYGYLCHLAADVIAHNYYVPYKIMRSFASVTMKHAYWEMRFETFVEKEIWDIAREVCQTDQRGNDALMRNVLTPTIFSFGTNKRIFNSIMLLSRLEKWQIMMQTLSENSRYQLAEEDRDEYLKLTEETVLRFLKNPESSPILQDDPTGEQALATAEAIRKNLRLLYKSGKITKQEGVAQVESIKSKLRQALDDPQILKDLYLK